MTAVSHLSVAEGLDSLLISWSSLACTRRGRM